MLKHLGQQCSPLRFIAQLPDTLVLEILTDDNKPLKSRCFPWRQIKQENAGFPFEPCQFSGSLGMHSHKNGFLLSESLDLGFNKILDHV